MASQTQSTVNHDGNNVPASPVYVPSNTPNSFPPGTGVGNWQGVNPSQDQNNNYSSWGVVAAGPIDSYKATYSVGGNGLVPPASCTDLIVLTGSATKTVRVTRIEVSGIATTILDTTVRLLLRTTADSGGTAVAVAPYAHDQTNAGATAAVATYAGGLPTVNDGTNRIVRASKLLFNLSAPAAGSESGRLMWDFGDRPGQAFVLRGITQQLAINLNGVSVSGGSVDWSIEFTEE